MASGSRMFVGRERELAELEGGLDEALKGGGRAFLIAGEPGIGKSTLCEELARTARERGAVPIWGRCWEGGGAPAFWPWVQILRSAVRTADPAVLRSGRNRTLLSQMVPELATAGAHVPELPAEEARFALFDAATLFLGAIATETPLVLLLEDVHAADLPSLLLLRFACSALRDANIALLITYREAEVRADPQLSSVLTDIGRDATALPLRGFTEHDIASFVETRAGAPAPTEVIRTLHETTGGNPFFLDGCVRLLSSEGRLFDTTARIAIPDGAREAIMRRLGRLSDPANEVLQIASMIGRDVDADLLAHVAGRERTEVIEQLRDPERAGLLRETSTAFGRFSFAHALIRDVVYDSIPGARRTELHRAVGDAIETRFPADLDAHLAELAHHALAAGDVGRAAEFSERAGRQALHSLAFEDACTHLERAADLVRADPARRARIGVTLADALGRAGELGRAREEYERAIDLAKDAQDPELAAEATLALGELELGGLWVRPWVPDRAWIRRLEEALGSVGNRPTAVRSRLLAHLGAALYFTDEQARGAYLSAQAVQIAESLGDDGTLALALTARHIAGWTADNLDERIELANRIVSIAGRAGARSMELQGLIWQYSDLLEKGDVAGARKNLQRYSELAEELRRPAVRAYALMSRAMLAMLEGRLDEARDLNAECRAILTDVGDEGGLASAYIQMFAIGRERGNVEDAVDVLRFYMRRYGDLEAWIAIGALIESTVGNVEEAMRRVRSIGPQARNDCFLLAAVSQTTEVISKARDAQLARTMYDLALPYADRYVVGGRNGVIAHGPMHFYLGLLAEMQNQARDAIAHYERAIEQMRWMNGLPALARSLARLAALVGNEDRPRAASLRAEAREIAQRCGLAPVLADLDAGLPRSDGLSMRREGDGWILSLDGRATALPDRVGLRYLSRLVASPRIEMRATELVADGDPGAGATGADDVLDDEARQAYRRRLAHLREELADAKEAGDERRAMRAEDEIDALTHQLTAATGLGGRARKLGAGSERARISVTKAIKAAIDRVADKDPQLGAHLATTVRTGSVCSYAPERSR